MYKINIGYYVNEKRSKTGVYWEYKGKRKSYKEFIPWWKQSIEEGSYAGVKVTNLETGEVIIFEKEK